MFEVGQQTWLVLWGNVRSCTIISGPDYYDFYCVELNRRYDLAHSDYIYTTREEALEAARRDYV